MEKEGEKESGWRVTLAPKWEDSWESVIPRILRNYFQIIILFLSFLRWFHKHNLKEMLLLFLLPLIWISLPFWYWTLTSLVPIRHTYEGKMIHNCHIVFSINHFFILLDVCVWSSILMVWFDFLVEWLAVLVYDLTFEFWPFFFFFFSDPKLWLVWISNFKSG